MIGCPLYGGLCIDSLDWPILVGRGVLVGGLAMASRTRMSSTGGGWIDVKFDERRHRVGPSVGLHAHSARQYTYTLAVVNEAFDAVVRRPECTVMELPRVLHACIHRPPTAVELDYVTIRCRSLSKTEQYTVSQVRCRPVDARTPAFTFVSLPRKLAAGGDCSP